jgi:hypothetical protein
MKTMPLFILKVSHRVDMEVLGETTTEEHDITAKGPGNVRHQKTY